MLKDREAKLLSSLADNPDYKEATREQIDIIEVNSIETEKAASDVHNFKKEFDEFISFAFNFIANKDKEWWNLSKQTLVVYKLTVFLSRIQVTQDKEFITRL